MGVIQPIHLRDSFYAVVLQENVIHAHIYDKEDHPVAIMAYIRDERDELHKLFKPGVPYPIPITNEKWELICLSKECEYADAIKVVEKFKSDASNVFRDYGIPFFDQKYASHISGFVCPIESLFSLLKGTGLDVNKNFAIIQKLTYAEK